MYVYTERERERQRDGDREGGMIRKATTLPTLNVPFHHLHRSFLSCATFTITPFQNTFILPVKSFMPVYS